MGGRTSCILGLKEDLDGQLGGARIPGLPGAEGAKRGIVVQLVECADLIGGVDGSGADALWSKVRVIEDIEIFGAELQPPAFRYEEILGELHVPIDRTRQAKHVFADVAKGAIDGRVVDGCPGIGGIGNLGRMESRRVEPADAICSGAARNCALRIIAGNHRATILVGARLHRGALGAGNHPTGGIADPANDTSHSLSVDSA